MNDFLGNEVKRGDFVAHYKIQSYGDLSIGVILNIFNNGVDRCDVLGIDIFWEGGDYRATKLKTLRTEKIVKIDTIPQGLKQQLIDAYNLYLDIQHA